MTDEQVNEFFKKRGEQLVEGIDLIDGVRVRRISKEDFEDLNPSRFPFPRNLRDLISPRIFVLEKYVSAKEHDEFGADKTMRNVVLALRLLKGGYVYGSYVFYIRLPDKRMHALTSWYWNEQPIDEILGFGYALNFDEISHLKKLLKKMQAVDFSKRKSLHLACRRFERAYGESDVEDRLIDLMIAFEALFLKGEKVGTQAGRTIAIACSSLLGKNEEEREEIKVFLNKAYSIRNQIVHGSEYKKPHIKGEEYEMEGFVSIIKNHLRESIKKLLD